jgi:hypothetical protein
MGAQQDRLRHVRCRRLRDAQNAIDVSKRLIDCRLTKQAMCAYFDTMNGPRLSSPAHFAIADGDPLRLGFVVSG